MLPIFKRFLDAARTRFDEWESGPQRKVVSLDDGSLLPFVRQPGSCQYLLHTAPDEMIARPDGTREQWQNGFITQAILPDGTTLKDFSVAHLGPVDSSDSCLGPDDADLDDAKTKEHIRQVMFRQREWGWRTKLHTDGSVTTRLHSTSIEKRVYADRTIEYSHCGRLSTPTFIWGPGTIDGLNPARIRPDGHKEYWDGGFLRAEVTGNGTKIHHERSGSRVEITAANVRTSFNAEGQIKGIQYPDGTYDRYEDGTPVYRRHPAGMIRFDEHGQGFREPTKKEEDAAYMPVSALGKKAMESVITALFKGDLPPAALTTPAERARGHIATKADIDLFNPKPVAVGATPATPFEALANAMGSLMTRVEEVLRDAANNPDSPSRENPMISHWADQIMLVNASAKRELQPRPVGRYQRLDA